MLSHYTVNRLIETKGMTVEMGGFVSWMEEIEMAPKVCTKLQMKARIRQEKTWTAPASGQRWVGLLQAHAEGLSLSLDE